MKTIYLDYAAATPLDEQVLKAMLPYLKEDFYNPSATYLDGRRVKRALETARTKAAAVLGSKPAEIIFTAGATEANNLAIQGVMKNYPDGELLVSAIEHESVLEPAGLYAVKKIKVSRQGIIDLADLEKNITAKTTLISVMMVNNETGTIQPLKEIAELLRQIRKQRMGKRVSRPIYLHTDAAQAPVYLDVHVSRLGVDLMSLNGGKIYGPKQSGALYVRAGTQLQPLILGGGQESGLRSGTENVAGAIGFAEALAKASASRHTESARIRKLKNMFLEGLAKIPGAAVNGSIERSSPHIVSVTFKGADNERLMMQLDEAGIQAAIGSACSASSLEPSHVLKALGLSRAEARSSLRFSFGRATTEADISLALKKLRRLTAV